jgi:hypothetical protein
MPSSLVTDEDYDAEIESVVPRWRREVLPSPSQSRVSAKYRSQHSIQLPSGSLLITLRPDAEEPGWLVPAIGLLSRLGSLPENWDSYGARSISLHSVAGVLTLLGRLMTDTTPRPALVPTRNGGIQIEWHTKGIDLEIQVSPTGLYRASFEDSRLGTEWAGDITSNLSPLREVLTRLATG